MPQEIVYHFRGGKIVDNKAFREELIKGIVEVAQETGLSVNQCIMEAMEMLKKQKKEQYIKQLENQIFKGW